MNDIYSDPETFGLELIWTADEDEPYEFDIVAAWGSKLTGAVYLGRDSGCSCPSPFEDYTQPNDINRLTRVDPARGSNDIRKAIIGTMKDGHDWSRRHYSDRETDRETQTQQDDASAQGTRKILDWSHSRTQAVPA